MEDKETTLAQGGQAPLGEEPRPPAPESPGEYMTRDLSGLAAKQANANQRRLKNGAIYDMIRHRIVANPGGGLAAFDANTAREAQARAQQLKRDAIRSGAQAALSDIRQRLPVHDLEFVEAVAEAAMFRAVDTDPANSKQIDAARFLLQETGLAEQKQQEQPSAAESVARGLLLAVYDIAHRAGMLNLTTLNSSVDVVDAQVDDSTAEK